MTRRSRETSSLCTLAFRLVLSSPSTIYNCFSRVGFLHDSQPNHFLIMSERMIELQRAKLLATGKGGAGAIGTVPANNGTGAVGGGMPTPAQPRYQTPQQIAQAYVQREDRMMKRFLQRLQERDDMATGGPTVPTALSRRILHKQGAGYLDDTVGAIASASADRFLATVLQQAVACRDQRLKGAELAKEAANHKKRHLEHYKEDTDDRKRQKEQFEEDRERANLAAIEAAKSARRSGAGGAAGTKQTKSKKKKVVDSTSSAANDNKPKAGAGMNEADDENSYGSIDEEEQHYQDYYGDSTSDVDGSDVEGEDDEEDDAVVLRDIARPLEAWNFHVTGKIGMGPNAFAQDVDEDEFDDDMEDEDVTNQADDQTGDGGDDVSGSRAPSEQEQTSSKNPLSSPRSKTEKKSPDGNKTPRKSAPSPKPAAMASK